MNPHPPENGRDGESVSSEVVRTVAAYANERPTDLPQLSEVIDPDALNVIFASKTDGTPRSNGKVVFPYAGFRITVSADGAIDIDHSDPEG